MKYTEVTDVAKNPFSSVKVGGLAAPAFGDDWNGDGVPDLLVGTMPGANKFHFYLSNFCKQACANVGSTPSSFKAALRHSPRTFRRPAFGHAMERCPLQITSKAERPTGRDDA